MKWCTAKLMATVALLVFVYGDEKEEVDLKKKVEKQEEIIGSLTRQIMMAQLVNEESVRSGGDSGVKQTRLNKYGTRPYFTPTHIKQSVNSIHDHSQNARTVGMGEVAVVMNGLEFRTRHNDYALTMPHATSSEYHATQELPFPDVPPEVLAQPTIHKQVKEMKLWFKAWKNGWTSTRDYRKYFKPTLCYLEGAWTQSSDVIDEPFESDRHFVDAKNWWDLTEKVRFTAFSGTKSNKENYSFLPMKIMNLDANGHPIFAQWNYRILCHPLKRHIPLHYFRMIDDLSIRLRDSQTLENFEKTRKPRYELHAWNKGKVDKEYATKHALLDELMAEIPGMDNYQGKQRDDAFGNIAMYYKNKSQELNTAFYHRIYQGEHRGAMGSLVRHRGFADRNLFMAQTSQTKIPSLKVHDCYKDECGDYEQRWTYAIPLEIIYLTPLYKWNPYNLTYAENKKDPNYNKVTKGGRNGGLTKDTAYDGSRRNIFYRTPEELFEGGGEVEKDPADTSKGTVGVLDPSGKVRRVVASGTRILLPEIPGLGVLRTRYPISPLYNDGSQIYKEVEALKDIVMSLDSHRKMLKERPWSDGTEEEDDSDETRILKMTMTTQDPPGMHTHEIELTNADLEELKETGEPIEVNTDESNGHQHILMLRYDAKATQPWVIDSCDTDKKCWDGHENYVVLQK